MKNLTQIELTNIVYFKHALFKFAKGLTFIQGKNLQRRGTQASNGSGKSLLFGALPNLVLDAHPILTKNGRTIQKQMYGKGSKASLTFREGKHEYQYDKTGTKVMLSRDGQNLESRIARDQLKSLIDLSEEEFFSTVYLDSRRHNNFQMGSAADRYAYIVSLFRLHDMDEFRKHINKQITALKGDESVLAQTIADLADAQAVLDSIPIEVVKQAEAEGQWLSDATNRLQTLQALVHNWESYSKYTKSKLALGALDKPDQDRATLRTNLRLIDQYEAAVAQWRKTRTRMTEWQAELDKLPITDKDLNRMSELQESTRACGSGQNPPTKPKSDEQAAERHRKYLPKREAVEKRVAKAQSALGYARQVLTKFDRDLADHDQCPTCHGQMTSKTKKLVREQLEAPIAVHEAERDKFRQVLSSLDVIDEWSEYRDQKAEWDKWSKVFDRLNAYDFESAARYRELTRLVADTSAGDKPQKPDLDRTQIETDLEAWDAYEAVKNRVQALRCEKPEQKASTKEIEELQAKIQNAMSGLSALQARASDRKNAARTCKQLKQRRDELEQGLQDLPVYKMLTDAYSTSGLKTLMVQRLAKALEKNMNKYAKTIFAEDFAFQFDVADGHFNVIVNRKVEGKSIPSDIRHMSGAESRLFVFLFVLAMLPMIPDKRRMNVMILDEPDANMDVMSREVLRDSLLPRLAKVVPCLIVISPNSDIVPQHARVFTVVKNHGEAKLIRGTYESSLSAPAAVGTEPVRRSAKPNARSVKGSSKR